MVLLRGQPSREAVARPVASSLPQSFQSHLRAAGSLLLLGPRARRALLAASAVVLAGLGFSLLVGALSRLAAS